MPYFNVLKFKSEDQKNGHQRSIEDEKQGKLVKRGGGGAKKRSKKVGEKRPKKTDTDSRRSSRRRIIIATKPNFCLDGVK